MPTLVHLANEKDAEKIRHSGLKFRKNGSGIYCMPVLPDFYVSHQWLRELKRWGAKTFVGVYFKIDSSEMVYTGRYNRQHKHITLGAAIREIMDIDDPLGYELIINRKIGPKEITKIRHLPQKLGWRYFPESHNNKPCSCEYCLKGTMNGKKTWKKLNSE
jgi:hypothetical protein